MIVWFLAPTFVLLLDQISEIRISLHAAVVPTTLHFAKRLGNQLTLHSAGLGDESVHLTDQPPQTRGSKFDKIKTNVDTRMNNGGNAPYQLKAEITPTGNVKSIGFFFGASESSEEGRLLLDKSTKVELLDSSACSILFQVGGARPRSIYFPTPILPSTFKWRLD